MDDATGATIAIPAEDPHLLAISLLDMLGTLRGARIEPLRPFNLPNSVGESWTGRTPVESEGGVRIWVGVWAFDREAAKNKVYRPKEMTEGAWGYLTIDVREEGQVEATRILADRIGGFLQFEKRRTLRDGGDLIGPWEEPRVDCAIPGCDLAKHRLLRALGFEAAAVVERILRSEDTMTVVLETLEAVHAEKASRIGHP